MDARTSSLKTPLHYATLNDRYEFTYLLLMKGACVDARDKYEMTPLHHAAGIGHSVVVRLLLDRKADLRARNHNGKTPLRLSQDDIESAYAATRVLCQREGISFAEAQKGRRWDIFPSEFSVDKRNREMVYSMKDLEVMLDIVAGVEPPGGFAFSCS